MSVVTGTLYVPAAAQVVNGVRVSISVRDITFSDAPSETPVVQKEMQVDLAPDGQIEFDIDVPDQELDRVENDGLALNLEVHIDLDGSGAFSSGDLVSMEAQPIDKNTPGNPLTVPLVMV